MFTGFPAQKEHKPSLKLENVHCPIDNTQAAPYYSVAGLSRYLLQTRNQATICVASTGGGTHKHTHTKPLDDICAMPRLAGRIRLV